MKNRTESSCQNKYVAVVIYPPSTNATAFHFFPTVEIPDKIIRGIISFLPLFLFPSLCFIRRSQVSFYPCTSLVSLSLRRHTSEYYLKMPIVTRGEKTVRRANDVTYIHTYIVRLQTRGSCYGQKIPCSTTEGAGEQLRLSALPGRRNKSRGKLQNSSFM